MKYRYFVYIMLVLLLAGWEPVSAQCERNEYPIIIRLAKEDMANRNYQRCIERLLDARDICPDEKEEVNRLIQQAFAQVEGEKNIADSALTSIYLNRLKSEFYQLEFISAETTLSEIVKLGLIEIRSL